MLSDAALGGLIGAGFALAFWAGVKSGLDRLNQGMFSTVGGALMLAVCLWTDGWLLTAVLGFVAAMAGLSRL